MSLTGRIGNLSARLAIGTSPTTGPAAHRVRNRRRPSIMVLLPRFDLTRWPQIDCQHTPMRYKENAGFSLSSIGGPYAYHCDGLGKPARSTAAGSLPLHPFDSRKVREHGQSR